MIVLRYCKFVYQYDYYKYIYCLVIIFSYLLHVNFSYIDHVNFEIELAYETNHQKFFFFLYIILRL